jgi:aerotaxis receptor
MRNNLPITQREFDFPEGEMLVSTTDVRGNIIHCNAAFVRVSGYDYDELIGQPHNLVRHPDMPSAAFRDMWGTIGRGHPWTGLVKNRRKDGDHYWVEANVIPIMENGKPAGYMSVRVKPGRPQVRETETLYARMREEAAAGHATLALRQGAVVRAGWRGRIGEWRHGSPTVRLGGMLAALVLAGALPAWLGLQGAAATGLQLGLTALGAVAIAGWFHRGLALPLREADRFASDLAGCNLRDRPRPSDRRHPLSALMRRLLQIQVNLQAVVGDVRQEVAGFGQATGSVAQGARDLSERTESQASSLEQTSASMEQLAGTVRQTADRVSRVSAESAESARVANLGRDAVRQVGDAMQAIRHSSERVRDIVGTIESIAFQTNLLALNAAVEAARAGDQGRGFAVVAAEVRGLAQRSATAAQEVRELIAESGRQIDDGVQRMGEADRTIAAVVGAVDRVSGLMAEIGNAAREQTVGIAQVNEAVTDLDGVTQRNAALVQDSAASAGALAGSAVALERTMQVFRLP